MNTPHVGIFMWVWLVDSWTWGRSWIRSIPTLVPYFLHWWIIPTFPEIKKKLMCLSILVTILWHSSLCCTLYFLILCNNIYTYIVFLVYCVLSNLSYNELLTICTIQGKGIQGLELEAFLTYLLSVPEVWSNDLYTVDRKSFNSNNHTIN